MLVKKRIFSLMLFVMIFSFSINTYAEGDGSGGGGGPSIPLYLTKSLPSEGSIDFSPYDKIILYFSHNVADVAIRDNNIDAISMATALGEKIQITVSFPDDFASRQQVFITSRDLLPFTTYVVTIGPTFMSRNEYRTATIETLSFTTGEEPALTEPTTQTSIKVQEETVYDNTATKSMTVNEKNQTSNSNLIESSMQNVDAAKTSNKENTAVLAQDNDQQYIIPSEANENAIPSESESESTILSTSEYSHYTNMKPGKVVETQNNEDAQNNVGNSTSIGIWIFLFIIFLILIILFIRSRRAKNGKV